MLVFVLVCVCYLCVCAHQLVIHSEEGHLTRLVDEVGEGDECVSLFHVQYEHSRYEGHALDLVRETEREYIENTESDTEGIHTHRDKTQRKS